MSKLRRKALVTLIVLFVVVLGLALIIPILVNVDQYRPQVIAQLQKETGKPVEVGHLDLTLLPRVAIRVDDFSLGNPTGFPAGDFVKAKKILAAVDVLALMHHKVEITSLRLEDLTLDLLEDANGKWNFENSPASPAAPSAAPTENSATFTLGVISKLSVTRGDFTAASLLPSGERGPSLVEVHNASIDVRDVNLNAMTTASLHQPVAGPGQSTALANLFSTTVYAADQPGPAVAEGTIKADALVFGPINVTEMKSKIRVYPKQVDFDSLDLKCYSGGATGNLSLEFGGPNLAYSVDAKTEGVKIAEFLDSFPQTRGLMTGTLEGAASMKGLVLKSVDPLEGVTGSGHGIIRDGKMPSLQITGNLRSLVRLASVGPANGDPSSFSSLSADFQIADDKLASNKISLHANGVDVEGSGSLTMAGEGTLDYQGEASLAANGNNPLAAILGGLAGARFSDGKMTFPFTVAGTFAHPRFSLRGSSEKGAGADHADGTEHGNLARGLSGFFKKRKLQ